MLATNFTLADYLKRISYDGKHEDLGANLATLTSLMQHQLYAVPFENLDVQAKKIVSLLPEDIVDKILFQGRGGYCYEVNGLFAMVLRALGFRYQFIACRPMYYPVRRPKTHMALIVSIEDRQWLVDLGFGGQGIRAPIALDQLGQELAQMDELYTLSKNDQGEYLLQARSQHDWANLYAFDLYATEWIDFAPANYLNSSHPDAFFVQKLLVARQTPTGRLVLLDNLLKTTAQGKLSEEHVPASAREAVLLQQFGLRAPPTA
jgi:N-hydroxyarylamine O-acetyltransferase